MRSTIGIDVDAPPELVFRLARDVERWPRLLPTTSRSGRSVAEAGGALVAQMIARRPLRAGAGPLVAGRLAGADVERRADAPAAVRPPGRRDRRHGRHVADRTARLPAAGSRSTTTSDRTSAPRAAFIDRGFTRPIASRTLATFKAIAEAVAT